ncbi:MAG TPA: membrane protein insertase YidC [Candidatus Binataceae bacterium]|nr:membrane protein insertase YidC [Candidatus Binataceae bacterium]
MDNTRLILAFVVSLVLIFVYQEVVLKRMFPPAAEQAAQKAKAEKAAEAAALPNAPTAAATAAAAIAAASPVAAAPAAAPTVAAVPVTPERIIQIDSDLFRAEITTRGARIKSFQLKRYRQTVAADSPWYEMVAPAGKDALLPLGAVLIRGGVTMDDHDLAYLTPAADRVEITSHNKTSVEFIGKTADGLTITKTFSFEPDTYVFNVAIAATGGPAAQQVGLSMSQPLQAHAGYYDIPELQADVADQVITETEKKLVAGVEPVSGTISYAGFGDRYFLSVLLPEQPASGTLTMAFGHDEAVARVLFAGTSQIHSRVYMGPKLLEALEAASPDLRRAIDFGWMGMLAIIFLRTLKLFHVVAPNYGVDILLVTVAVRVLSLPMSIKGQRSAMKLARLAPQLERLKEKYKDDQEQLQKETIDLYRRNHVNPIGGCAPMLIQLPIFIGLYEALLNAIELRQAPFIGWINDLSAPECLPIPLMPQLPLLPCRGLPVLVILMALSGLLQQYMMPKQPDPTQQRMMMFTPLFYVFIFVRLPAGLVLYYFASNALGVIQQYFLNREFSAGPT